MNAQYFADLEAQYRQNGIVVPLYGCHCLVTRHSLTRYRTYNDPGERLNFINGTGAPDIYGLVSAKLMARHEVMITDSRSG